MSKLNTFVLLSLLFIAGYFSVSMYNNFVANRAIALSASSQ